jgi:exosome complex RNA-binding protein Csl4
MAGVQHVRVAFPYGVDEIRRDGSRVISKVTRLNQRTRYVVKCLPTVEEAERLMVRLRALAERISAAHRGRRPLAEFEGFRW